MALRFLTSRNFVVAVSPNRLELQQLFDLSRASAPSSLDRLTLLWNMLASPSAEDDALSHFAGANPPGIHLNNLTSVFPKSSVLTLRFCLEQVDSFLLESSSYFFSRFKVQVIITHDTSNIKTHPQSIITAELRRRTYSSVRSLLAKSDFLPFDPSGKTIPPDMDSDWPAVVHWKNASFN